MSIFNPEVITDFKLQTVDLSIKKAWGKKKRLQMLGEAWKTDIWTENIHRNLIEIDFLERSAEII